MRGKKKAPASRKPQRRAAQKAAGGRIGLNAVTHDDSPASPAEDVDRSIKVLREWQSLNHWMLRDGMFDGGSGPMILDFVDSLMALRSDASLSLARMGDGELALATGVGVPNNGCQGASDSLKDALQRVLRCDNPKCRVALPKAFFYSEPMSVSHEIERFVVDAFRPSFVSGDYAAYIRTDYAYLDASMSVVRRHYPDLGRRVYYAYYSLLKPILSGRDVIVVSGDSRCFEYDRSLLADSGVKSAAMLMVPRGGAWELYPHIKQRLLDINGTGSRLVLLACGPTASVLAYELADKMRCLDMGHIFSDYNLTFDGAEIGSFWA